MANIFADRENVLLAPTLKMRQRLQSAPEKLLKSPMIPKAAHTPQPSGRKAFGAVNKQNVQTPAFNVHEKKLVKPQEVKVKPAPSTKLEEYPEIEKFIPYDPLEFEKYSVPEDLITLGVCAVPGLACFPPAPHLWEHDLKDLNPLPVLSPVKMPKHSDGSELDAFLQTLDELTIELPPEPVTDF